MRKTDYAAFLGFCESGHLEEDRADSDREEPVYTEEDVVEAGLGMGRILKKKLELRDQECAPPDLDKARVSVSEKSLPNVITKDRIFRSGAHPVFLARLLRERSIETTYLKVNSWKIARRPFGNGASELVQQIRRYGVAHVMTKMDSNLDDQAGNHMYVEFLLDPFHKQKMEEKRKRMEDMQRRRAVNLIATFGKQANTDSESSEDDDGMGDLEQRLCNLDVNQGPRIEQMILDIDDEEIPGFVDDRVHFEIVLTRGPDKLYYIEDLYFYIVSIQK